MATNSFPQSRSPWFTTVEGCQIWDSRPVAGESASWSGACVGGFGEGQGETVWKLPSQPVANGRGVIADASGLRLDQILDGEMHHGRYQGHLVMRVYEKDTGKLDHTITGNMVDENFEGAGSLKSADGWQYIGEFHLGMKDGHGVTVYPTGARYEGNFHYGSWEGPGRLTWGSDNSYVGSFYMGLPEGPGEALLRVSGRQDAPQVDLKGTWIAGCLTDSTPRRCIIFKT
ncbi:hypothetical protein [Lichenicola sp.]|uniref:hypothetical protein n=1 Tax=Lichenicola sp. TaxID=2804529 RepID=UPI003AFF6A9F